jgi:hypothetical protein
MNFVVEHNFISIFLKNLNFQSRLDIRLFVHDSKDFSEATFSNLANDAIFYMNDRIFFKLLANVIFLLLKGHDYNQALLYILLNLKNIYK